MHSASRSCILLWKCLYFGDMGIYLFFKISFDKDKTYGLKCSLLYIPFKAGIWKCYEIQLFFLYAMLYYCYFCWRNLSKYLNDFGNCPYYYCYGLWFFLTNIFILLVSIQYPYSLKSLHTWNLLLSELFQTYLFWCSYLIILL